MALTRTRSARRYARKKAAGGNSLLGRIYRMLMTAILVAIGFSVVLVGILRFYPAPISAFMLHKHVEDLAASKAFKAMDYRWVDASHISKHAFKAVIASEDQGFFQHHGFDFDAIYKAYQHNKRGRNIRGASTISQQVAKNMFLSPSRSWLRKALEVWFTLLIEVLWDKARILEFYLNIAELGDHIYGVEAASRYYFGLSAKRLSAEQAALLAATLPNPIKLKANRPSAYLRHRQRWILQQMRYVNAKL